MNYTPSLLRMIARALLRKCPRCGSRKAWFRNWYRQNERCVGCGLKRTRGTYGQELGALVVGNVFNLAIILIAILVVMLTVGESIDGIFAVTVTMMGIAVVIPTITWPMTHTLWMALDLRFRPVDEAESAEAAAWLSSL
jgi:uncharacterized protein (DUF983 family)